MKGKFSIFVGLLLVVSMVAMPANAAMAGSTDTLNDPGDCNNLANAFVTTISFGYLGTDCEPEDKVDAQQKLSLYSKALDEKDDQETITTLSGNNIKYIEAQSRSIINNKTRAAVLNNWSVSKAQSEINQSLNEFYSGFLKNTYYAWNNHLSVHLNMINQVRVNEIDHSVVEIDSGGESTWGDQADSSSWREYHFGYANETRTLPNGENVSVKVAFFDKTEYDDPVRFTDGHSANPGSLNNFAAIGHNKFDFTTYNESYTFVNHTGRINLTIEQGNEKEDGDTGESDFKLGFANKSLQTSGTVADSDDYVASFEEAAWDDLHKKTYDQLESYKIQGANTVESVLTSPNVTKEDYEGTKGLTIADVLNLWDAEENATGDRTFQCAKASSLGIDANINTSIKAIYSPNDKQRVKNGSQDTYTPDDAKLTGCIFTNWNPNSSTNYAFERGVWYDTDNASSPVFFAIQDSNTSRYNISVIALDGEFKLTEIRNIVTNKTSENIGLENKTPEVTNDSTVSQQLTDLIERQQEIIDKYGVDNQAGIGFGNTSGLFSGIPFVGGFLQNISDAFTGYINGAINAIISPFVELAKVVGVGLVIIGVGLLLLLLLTNN